MASKSLKKNYVYNLIYQILSFLTPLATTPYLSRVLGADGIGAVSYAESIVAYFTLFAGMGITIHGQREVSYVQDSIEKRSVVFWNTKLLSLYTSGAVLLLYILFAASRPSPTIYYIYILNIVAVAADITWFFQGLEEFGEIVLRNVIFKFVNIVYVFLVIRSADDINLYAFGHTFFSFLSTISLWGLLSGHVQKVAWKDLHPFKDLKVVLSLFMPTIAIQIYTVLDKTMIGYITQSAFENGFYEQAMKIAKIVLTIVTALGTVVIPRIGHFFEKKETGEIQRLMYRGYRFVWFLGIPLCFGLIMVSENFVPWFFGTGFDEVSVLLRILSFLILAIGINNVTGMQYMVPTRRQNTLTVTVVIGACVNFTLNLILIPVLKARGAAIASVIAEVTIAVVQIILVRKELSPVRILREGIPYFIAGSAMAAVLYFVRDSLEATVLNTFVLVCVGAMVYFSVLLVMRDNFFLSNLKTVFNKFRKS